MTKVTILGLGYVGLPLGVAIEESGKYEVLGFDIDPKRIETINSKKSPFPDKDVDERLKKIEFEASSNVSDLENTDIYIIAVPTPVDDEYEPNLGPVKSATEMIAKYLKKGDSVIVESTINPGVCEEVVLPILEEKTGLKGGVDFELAHCPERINPGDSKWNVYNIPRNIGAMTKEGTKKLADFYRSFLQAPINEVSSLKVAEATKIIENTFRDINIAYVNELAKSFDAMDIDLVETINGASNKPFGFMPHWPGVGVGGHCIAVDPYYLIKRAAQSGFDHEFLKVARNINNSMPGYTVGLLENYLKKQGTDLSSAKILLYGLSYKSNVGDLRESPSLVVKEILESKKINFDIFDPYFPDMSTSKDLDSVLSKVDTLLITTSHNEIKELDFSKYKNLKLIIDGRNCLDMEKIKSLGVEYKGIGR